MRNLTICLLLSILLSGCITGTTGTATHTDTTLKVLTINLCAVYTSPMQDRADKIVEFCKAEQVDVILTQEGVQGIGQFNATKYIAQKLGYSYTQVPTFGVPGFFEYCIGIIAAGPLTDTKGLGCQVSGGNLIDKVPFPGASRGVMANYQGVTLVSSHLTVPVTPESRQEQVKCLMDKLPGGIVIWGGDFNFTRSDPAYPMIRLQEALYAGRPMVDMIFYQGLSLLDCKSVFEDKIVSDHAGVLARFGQGN